MIYDKDADLARLEGKTVAILGYGSQGHAHALNLTDSGVDVVVGLREGSSSVEKAKGDGVRVEPIADAASVGDVVMVLLPDEKQAEVWDAEISDGVAPGNLLMFAHGFSIHFGQIDPGPEVDVGMVAPKGPGHLVRRQFLEGNGVPGLVAVHQDATGTARDLVLAYAKGIGGTRAARPSVAPICWWLAWKWRSSSCASSATGTTTTSRAGTARGSSSRARRGPGSASRRRRMSRHRPSPSTDGSSR